MDKRWNFGLVSPGGLSGLRHFPMLKRKSAETHPLLSGQPWSLMAGMNLLRISPWMGHSLWTLLMTYVNINTCPIIELAMMILFSITSTLTILFFPYPFCHWYYEAAAFARGFDLWWDLQWMWSAVSVHLHITRWNGDKRLNDPLAMWKGSMWSTVSAHLHLHLYLHLHIVLKRCIFIIVIRTSRNSLFCCE